VYKDFDRWNIVKQQHETRSPDLLYHTGEIWWCTIGINIGVESCGKGGYFRRPVLVLKKLSRKCFIGIPLSTQAKTGSWFQEIIIHDNPRWALLYQIRSFSTNRLQRRLATLEGADFLLIKQKLKTLLEL
jgi:mRNA interferase MazF